MSAAEIPQQFTVAMPDDALAPRVPKGMRLMFERDAKPAIGDGILVEDKRGWRGIRRYAEAPGGAWLAQAINDAYATLHSDRDGLKILAAMTGRRDGSI